MASLKKIEDGRYGFGFGWEIQTENTIIDTCHYCHCNVSIPFFYCKDRNKVICYDCENTQSCSVLPSRKAKEHIHYRIVNITKDTTKSESNNLQVTTEG